MTLTREDDDWDQHQLNMDYPVASRRRNLGDPWDQLGDPCGGGEERLEKPEGNELSQPRELGDLVD